MYHEWKNVVHLTKNKDNTNDESAKNKCFELNFWKLHNLQGILDGLNGENNT